MNDRHWGTDGTSELGDSGAATDARLITEYARGLRDAADLVERRGREHVYTSVTLLRAMAKAEEKKL